MIDYEIVRVLPEQSFVQVKYSKEGEPDFFHRFTVSGYFTEENIHKNAKEKIEWAVHYWANREENDGFALTETVGQAKNIEYDSMPEFDSSTQIVENYIEEDETTVYHKKRVVDIPPDELGKLVKDKRDVLLAATDTEALSDRTMSDAMTAYRQALRDVPQQAGFPTDVVWPVKPID